MAALLESSYKFQVLESVEADFGELTWTFRISGNGWVGHGNFAVLPVERFARLTGQLTHAEGLLRQWLSGHLDDGFKERVESHFDPEPL